MATESWGGEFHFGFTERCISANMRGDKGRAEAGERCLAGAPAWRTDNIGWIGRIGRVVTSLFGARILHGLGCPFPSSKALFERGGGQQAIQLAAGGKVLGAQSINVPWCGLWFRMFNVGRIWFTPLFWGSQVRGERPCSSAC